MDREKEREKTHTVRIKTPTYNRLMRTGNLGATCDSVVSELLDAAEASFAAAKDKAGNKK